MASIQQSLNQMLMSAQVGAGLYAHSPAGKEQAEVSRIKRDLPKVLKAREQQADLDLNSEAAEKAYRENLDLGTKMSKRLYELRPTEQNYRNMIAEAEGKEEYEDILAQSMMKRDKTISTQKEALATRIKLLEGDPNPLGIEKTKINLEGDKDGK